MGFPTVVWIHSQSNLNSAIFYIKDQRNIQIFQCWNQESAIIHSLASGANAPENQEEFTPKFRNIKGNPKPLGDKEATHSSCLHPDDEAQ